MLDKLLDKAMQEDASDVHIVHGIKPSLRIKRELVELEDFDIVTPKDAEDIVNKLVNNDQRRLEMFHNQRKLDLSYRHRDIRCRVNISLSSDYPVITIRLIKNELPSFESLGLPEIINSLILQPQGLILVTGKTNSGKSTTLNVMIDRINKTQKKKIITLENPVEFMHKSEESIIVQKEIGAVSDCRSFSEGVKNALREDADILVCGEIRDRETMDAAIEMAESGHLVVGTIHTKSCAETIDRIINFYDVKDQINIKYLMSTLLKSIVSQRLVKGKNGDLVLIPEVMIIDNAIAGSIRKEKFSVAEIEDLIQSGFDKGNISYVYSLAKAFVEDKLELDQIKLLIEEKNYEMLNRLIMQLKVRR